MSARRTIAAAVLARRRSGGARSRSARRVGQAPAAGEHAADQRVVDAELAALAVHALLGGAGLAVDLVRVGRVGVHEHELADVVQQRRDQQLVALGDSPSSRASRSAADWVATACRRKRSGAASQPGVRSKKSKTWSRCGERLDALGRRASRRPRGCSRSCPSCWPAVRLAIRSTVITSATSDSTAATTSPTEARSSRTSAQHAVARLRERGNASSASNAAVSRRPWPSLCWRAERACGGGGCLGRSSAGRFASVDRRTASVPSPALSASLDETLSRAQDPPGGATSAASMRASVSSRPSAATDSKIPGETVRAADGDAHGLEDVLAASPRAPRPPRAAPPRPARRRTARPPASASRAARGARGRRRVHHLRPGLLVEGRRSTRKPASGQKSASVCIFSCATSTAAPRPVAPVQRLEARRELRRAPARAGSGRSSSAASARRRPPATSTPARARSSRSARRW